MKLNGRRVWSPLEEMNRALVAGCCVLVGVTAYQWTENGALQTRLDQAHRAAAEAAREARRLREQLAERDRQLESAQAARDGANRDFERNRAVRAKADPAAQTAEKARGEAVSPFVKSVLSLAERAAELDRALKSFPSLDIPEIGLLKETDWMEVASEHSNLETVDQITQALKQLANKAQIRAGNFLMNAVMESGDVATLHSLDAVGASLSKTMSPDLIQRYELVPVSQFDPALQKYVSAQVVSGEGKDAQHPLLVVRGREIVDGKQLVVIYSQARSENGKTSTASVHLSLRDVRAANPTP